MAVWAQGSQYSGYDYVQATVPEAAEEGETWYDIESDRAAVYTGIDWVEMTVTDHGQLSGVDGWQHLSQADVQGAVHDRYTDNEAVSATDGVIDAATLDGQTPDDLEVPSGIISLWSGLPADIPDGWTLCDGSDGTPDLTDRFIVGAGGQYSVGATGGAEQVQLSESEMPSHAHNVEDQYAGGSDNNPDIGQGTYGSYITRTVTSSSAGGDEAHENRPPYFALAYIMKV